MKVSTPEISWHERDPIYSVDFQPGNHHIQRLASGGVDKIVRLWQMTHDSDGKGHFEFLANLRRHTASVNVVRFSKNGEFLASAGDDSFILIWNLSDVTSPSNNIFCEEEVEEDKETWTCHKTLRGHLGDVQDLSWSKDSRFLISGSVDNSAIVWDVKKAQKIAFFNDHKSYVQGVAFDPLGDFVATLSSDRSMRIFSLSSTNCVNNVCKITPPPPTPTPDQVTQGEQIIKPKSFRIFHDDGLRSFFRRLEFSSDGHLLFAPTGCMEIGEKTINCSFVFVRGAFGKPALYLPCGEKASTVIRANPQLFELRRPKDFDPESQTEEKSEWESHKSLFCLPYRIVFAVATDDSVILYDSQQTMPVAMMKNMHYHQISDLSWSSDGLALIISSTDGFCTIAIFEDGELGIPYSGDSRRSARQKNEENVKPEFKEEEQSTAVSDVPFSQYKEEKSDKEKTVPVINTKLNIRKVSPKPSKSKSPGNKTEINTTLNIRKAKRVDITTPLNKDGEDKSSTESNDKDLSQSVKKIDIEDVIMEEEASVVKDKDSNKEIISDIESKPEEGKEKQDKSPQGKGKKRIQFTTIG